MSFKSLKYKVALILSFAWIGSFSQAAFAAEGSVVIVDRVGIPNIIELALNSPNLDRSRIIDTLVSRLGGRTVAARLGLRNVSLLGVGHKWRVPVVTSPEFCQKVRNDLAQDPEFPFIMQFELADALAAEVDRLGFCESRLSAQLCRTTTGKALMNIKSSDIEDISGLCN